MHASALKNAAKFNEIYIKDSTPSIAEIGSQIVKGQASLRDIFKNKSNYIGIDFQKKDGVDIILEDPYSFPIEDNHVDIVISSSCFEHSEFFWLTFLEMVRICKKNGLIYINTPSNGMFHRYPIDCWRFYPDSGIALQNWARRNNLEITLLESYTSLQANGECWSDFISIYSKGQGSEIYYPDRIISKFSDFKNGIVHGSNVLAQEAVETEDMARRSVSRLISDGSLQINW
jgi:SAM-dependent methyltransferase